MQSDGLENQEYISVSDKGFYFTALGGVGEIGMNFGLYACDGRWLAVDCGLGFAGDGLPGIDKLLPDPAFAQTIAPNLTGLIITHAHEDHIGAVVHFWQYLRCPVYATPFAAEILEDRFAEAGLLGRVPLRVVHGGDELDLSPFEIETVELNHSIPEPLTLLIRTPYGSVLHTGDWKFDPEPVLSKPANEKNVKKFAKEKPIALIGDSTNVFVDHDGASEADVRRRLVDLFQKRESKRIVVTCFASNVGRMESIAYAAAQCGRDVCLIGRSLWRIEGAARAAGYFKDVPEFLTPEEAQDLPANRVVYILTGCQGEPRAALSNLSYGVLNTLSLDKGDTVIFSSRAIPGNEQAIANIQNRFIAKDVEVVTSAQVPDVHSSGHANRSDMERLYRAVKPAVAIPVHGEIAHLTEHAALARACGVEKTVVIHDGDVVRLAPDGVEIVGQVQTGVLAVDGKKIIPVNADVIRKRRKMLSEGTVVVTLVLDKKGKMLGEAQVSAVGLIDADSDDMTALKQSVREQIEALDAAKKKDDAIVADTVKAGVRKSVMQTHGRKPMVETHLVRI